MRDDDGGESPSTAPASPSTTSLLRPASTRRLPSTRARTSTLSLSDVRRSGHGRHAPVPLQVRRRRLDRLRRLRQPRLPDHRQRHRRGQGQVRDDDGGETSTAPTSPVNSDGPWRRRRQARNPTPERSRRRRRQHSTARRRLRGSRVCAAGTTTVNCSATDNAGNTGTQQRHGQPSSRPTARWLRKPANITGVEATGPGGAVVSYANPSASDLVDGTVSVSCSPLSGSAFALGDDHGQLLRD